MFFKRLIANLTIISIIFLLACPIVGTRFSYAENSPEGWQDLTNTSELVDAFRFYCKSRDLTIDGTVPGMVTEFTTDVFNGLCVATGINITQLQAELKKTFDGNGAVQYLFTRTGVTAYNRLFAQFLQDNQLQTGDTVDNKQIYDGTYIHTDDNKHGCLVYVINRSASTSNNLSNQNKSLITQYGTPLISADTLFSEIPLNSFKNYSFTFNSRTYTGDLSSLGGSSNGLGINHMVNQNYFGGNDYLSANDAYWANNVTNTAVYGCISIFKFNNAYVLGVIGVNAGWGTVNTSQFNLVGVAMSSLGSYAQSGSVYINAPTTINNNVYEGDTIINNNGDVINNDPDPDPDNWDYPDIPSSDPYPGQPGSGINWPSLDLPDIDLDSPGTWSLGDITEKFPFSIPFDLVALLTVLNHEPVTPDFTSDIQIGSIYNWHIDADLSDYNGIASLIRTFEFIGFCVGLLYFTVRIVKG